MFGKRHGRKIPEINPGAAGHKGLFRPDQAGFDKIDPIIWILKKNPVAVLEADAIQSARHPSGHNLFQRWRTPGM